VGVVAGSLCGGKGALLEWAGIIMTPVILQYLCFWRRFLRCHGNTCVNMRYRNRSFVAPRNL